MYYCMGLCADRKSTGPTRFNFRDHDRAIISTRLFINVVLWILTFFISTISENAILKFYKIVFWFDNLSTVFILFKLILFTKYSKEALMHIMSMDNEDTLMAAIDEATTIYGVGAIGVYDLGTLSPFIVVDNAVLMFSGIYLCFAFIRSMIVRIMYLNAEECINLKAREQIGRHYIHFAVLPLSTEFLYGQKIYTTYLYSRIIINVVSSMTLCTLTLSKMLHSQFRSVKSVYLVGLLCVLGFILSVPVAISINKKILNGILAGAISTTLYVGGFRMAIIMWLYGVDRFSTDIHFWLGFKPTKFWTFTWILLPAILLIRCAMTLYESMIANITAYEIMHFVWFSLMVLIAAVHQIKTVVSYVLRNNVIGAFKCSKRYGPPDLEDRVLRWNYNSTLYHRQCFHNCMLLDEAVDCNHLPLMNKEEHTSSLDASAETSLMHLYEADPLRSSSSFMALGDIVQLD